MLMASARSTPGRPGDLRALGERASIRWFYGLRGLVPHRGSLSCGSVNTTTCSMGVGREPPDVVIWSWYRIPDPLMGPLEGAVSAAMPLWAAVGSRESLRIGVRLGSIAAMAWWGIPTARG